MKGLKESFRLIYSNTHLRTRETLPLKQGCVSGHGHVKKIKKILYSQRRIMIRDPDSVENFRIRIPQKCPDPTGSATLALKGQQRDIFNLWFFWILLNKVGPSVLQFGPDIKLFDCPFKTILLSSLNQETLFYTKALQFFSIELFVLRIDPLYQYPLNSSISNILFWIDPLSSIGQVRVKKLRCCSQNFRTACPCLALTHTGSVPILHVLH